MKKMTWKKIVSFVIVLALVLGAMRFNSAKVMADEEVTTPYSQDSAADSDANVTIGGTLTSKTDSADLVDLDLNYTDSGVKKTENGKEQTGENTAEIIVVVDLSNSMSESDVAAAKTATYDFVNSILSSKDAESAKVAVLTYNSSTSTVYGFASASEKDAILTAIDNNKFNQNSGTNTENALNTAKNMFGNATSKIIVLLSDGEPNIGRSPWTSRVNETIAVANTIKDSGVRVIAISYADTEGGVACLQYIASPDSYDTALKSDPESLGITFGKVFKDIINEFYIYAENEKMTVKLVAENFSFKDEDGITEKTFDIENNQIPKYDLKVKRSANELAKAYGVTEGVLRVPGVESVVFTYTFGDEQTRTLKFGPLYLNAAVKQWNINYFVQTLDSQSEDDFKFVESQTTEYRFNNEDDFVISQEYVGPVSAHGNYEDKYYEAAEIKEAADSKNTWNVYYYLKSNSWNVRYLVDGEEVEFVEEAAVTYYDDTFTATAENVKKVSELANGQFVDDAYGAAEIISPTEEEPFTWTVSYTQKTSTVNFYINNEPFKTVTDVKYGDKVEAPEIVLPENSETETEKVTYSTEGWDKLAELESVTSDLDVYATIVKTVVKKEIIPEVKTYTVEFYLDEKLVETRSEVAEGSSVEAPEIKLPANEETATEIITYSTKGWDKTKELKSVTSDLKVYATIDKNVEKKEIIPEVKKYTVEFYIDGALVETKNDVEEGSAVVAPEIVLPANEETATEIITYSTKGWDKTEELKNVTSDLKVYATIDKNVEKKVIPTPIEKPAEPIIIYIPETTPTPIVTPEPTPEPTPIVTPEPTPEPTPEVVEEIETPEVPEGTPEEEEEIEEVEEVEEVEEEEDIEIEEIETPEGEPEEEDIEIDEIETPEGLPQTGTTSVVVFFGIGAACIIFGGALIIKIRRREDEM